MINVTTYLSFEGNCIDAMEFYKSCFGGELTVSKAKDSPMKDDVPADMQDKIIHSHLKSDIVELMASDWLNSEKSPKKGNTVSLCITADTREELEKYYSKLSVDAEETETLQKTFFGTYGTVTDKFGVHWMFQSNEG
jgi:PhnB protein